MPFGKNSSQKSVPKTFRTPRAKKQTLNFSKNNCPFFTVAHMFCFQATFFFSVALAQLLLSEKFFESDQAGFRSEASAKDRKLSRYSCASMTLPDSQHALNAFFNPAPDPRGTFAR